jgi:hypothetical protein
MQIRGASYYTSLMKFTLYLLAIKSVIIIIICALCWKITSFCNAKMPTTTYFMIMKTESRTRIHFLLESVVREGKKENFQKNRVVEKVLNGLKLYKWCGSQPMDLFFGALHYEWPKATTYTFE